MGGTFKREAWRALSATPARSNEARRQRDDFRWMLEEFKVSVFAQELGTVAPVSAPWLDVLLEQIRRSP